MALANLDLVERERLVARVAELEPVLAATLARGGAFATTAEAGPGKGKPANGELKKKGGKKGGKKGTKGAKKGKKGKGKKGKGKGKGKRGGKNKKATSVRAAI